MAEVDNATIKRMVMAGDAHMRAGRLQAAATAFRDVLAISPRCAPALASLGWVLGLMGDNAQAADILRRAIAVEGSRGVFHYFLGTVLQRLGKADEALECYQKAIALTPQMPDSYGAAASVYERTHKLEQACELLERGLKIAPNDLQLASNLWSIRARRGQQEQARDAMRKLVAAMPANEPPESAARVNQILAQIEDRMGEYDQAFEHFRAMNENRLRWLGPRIAEAARYIESFAQYRGLTSDMAKRWAAEKYDDGLADPLFLVGFPRSGTTMTEQILGSHPRIVATDERAMLIDVSSDVVNFAQQRRIPEALDALTREHILKLRRSYWEATKRFGVNLAPGQVLLDKFPMHLGRLSIINRVFPRARVLVALRDPRDCCISAYMQAMQLNPGMMQMLRLDTAARLYATLMDLYLSEREKLTIAVKQIRYEDTIDDLETQARQMLDFLGLEWNDDVLKFHIRAKEKYVTTPSYLAVSQPVNKKAQGRWINYRRHIEPIVPVLAPYLQEFGYEPA